MSFIDIKNPQERDRIVQDYINTRNELRAKAENDKARGLTQQIQLVKTYTPLIKATQESSSKGGQTATLFQNTCKDQETPTTGTTPDETYRDHEC